MAAPHVALTTHIDNELGHGSYTTSASTVTFTSPTMTQAQLEKLVEVAKVLSYNVSLTAGTLKVAPGH